MTPHYKHIPVSIAAVLLWFASISTGYAFGPTECPASRFGSNLSCTANDVSITGIAVAGGPSSCVAGSSVTLDLDLTVNSGSPNRYDIGIFISNDGKDPLLTPANNGPASCSVDILPPNDPPFRDLDPGPWSGVTDVCGDVNGSMNGGTGSGTHTMTNVTVACQGIAGGGGGLYIPFVVSWDNKPTKNPKQEGLCTSSNDVVPAGKPKCNSPTVAQGTVAVVVLPSITKTDGTTTIVAGSSTTYSVVITNNIGDTLNNAVFKDPAVTDLTVDSVTCAAAGGATCPATTITDMQGAGITIPAMPVDSSVTFTINATLAPSATGTLTNTASVTVSGYSNSASDVNTIISVDHFDITHDGYGINCVSENITVTAKDNVGATITSFVDGITLDTQTGKGTWNLISGSGTFTDATANDGEATYTFNVADNGTATFSLDYQEGTATFDIDAYLTSDNAIRDDDTEGNITFSPSGFTVTASALSNPPPNPISDPITSQTAGTNFPLYITAYGQTPTDPTCGVIEAYTGNKTLKFWSTYIDPTPVNAAGTQATINGSSIATSEAASANQTITFTNGQASVTAKYKDAGSINIAMKDDSVADPNLPNGIRGATNNFVVKPAAFVLSNIIRTSDSFANPAAADENGIVFISAGSDFSITVTAIDAEGSTTPSYGKETAPETVALTSNLIDPAGGNNPAIAFTTGFGSFTNGVATGTDFSWAEVGIITLTPGIGDGNYLGAGNVTGTTSGNVGRFTPHHFDVTRNHGCNLDAFTYSAQPFLVTATARNRAGIVTVNYEHDGTSGFAKNTTISNAGNAANFTNNTITASDFTNGVGSTDPVSTPATAIKYTIPTTTPSPVILTLRAVDADSVSSSGYIEETTEVRLGRLYIENAYGSELIDLGVPTYVQYHNGTDYVINTADNNCTTVSVSLSDPDATDTLVIGNGSAAGETCIWDDAGNSGSDNCQADATKPQFTEPPSSGDFNLHLKAPGASYTGNMDITVDAPAWLEYDWKGAGATDPIGRATFGLYRGDDRIIYWREVFD